tara:strand:- start:486 stop:1331 length:846 start_codon:yes stop_codon:yes gene_type:complete
MRTKRFNYKENIVSKKITKKNIKKNFKQRRQLPEGYNKPEFELSNETDYNLYDNSDELFSLLREQFLFVKNMRYDYNEFKTLRVLNFIYKILLNTLPNGISVNLFDYVQETMNFKQNLGTSIFFDKPDDSFENYLSCQIKIDKKAKRYIESVDKKYQYSCSVLVTIHNEEKKQTGFSIYTLGGNYYIPTLRSYNKNNIFNFIKLKPGTFIVERQGDLIVIFTDGENDFRIYKLDKESNTLNYLDILEKDLPNMDSILPNFEMENYGEIDEQDMEKRLIDEF